jgi:hypothetical protein
MAGFDPTHRIWIQRRDARASGGAAGCVGRQRRPLVNGGGLDSVRGKLLDAAHGTTSSYRAALAAGTRRRRHTKRRRGSGSGGAPASNCGRCEARDRRQATPAGSSPPCASLGVLLYDEATAAARIRRRRRKPRVRVPVAAAHEGKAARVGTSRGGGRLIRVGRTTLACGPRTGKRAPLGLGGGGVVESGSGTTRAWGCRAGPTGQPLRQGERSGGGRGLAWAERPRGLEGWRRYLAGPAATRAGALGGCGAGLQGG